VVFRESDVAADVIKRQRRGIFVVLRFVKPQAPSGATSSGGRVEYVAPDGA
jgi:hypothetical protein